jgi:myosin heavy chain 9/10/11/14
LKTAKNRCERFEQDLQDLHTHRDYETKERSLSLEQTRSKYQRELEELTKELDEERNSAVNVHAENRCHFDNASLIFRRLRAELENMQAHIHDDRASGSNWAKEKSRMEAQYKLLSESFEETLAANREAQSQQVALLSQNRSLRARFSPFSASSDGSLEQAEVVRAELLQEKMRLENRLQNLNELDLFSHDTNPDRHPGILEKKIVDLKSEVAEKQDAVAAAIEKMRRAEKIAVEAQKEIAAERRSIVQLHKDKVCFQNFVSDDRRCLRRR